MNKCYVGGWNKISIFFFSTKFWKPSTVTSKSSENEKKIFLSRNIEEESKREPEKRERRKDTKNREPKKFKKS